MSKEINVRKVVRNSFIVTDKSIKVAYVQEGLIYADEVEIKHLGVDSIVIANKANIKDELSGTLICPDFEIENKDDYFGEVFSSMEEFQNQYDEFEGPSQKETIELSKLDSISRLTLLHELEEHLKTVEN